MAAGAESSEVLTQKVWLKVSIHCEGCKKKIRRILSKVRGVTHVEIDAPRKMVTVTGSVDGNTLVKRLAKSRKYAEELVPESKPAPAKSNTDAAPDHPKDEMKDTSKPKEMQEATPEGKTATAAPATAADAAAPTAKSVDASTSPAATPAPDAVAEPAQTNAETEKKDDKKSETDDKKIAADGAAAAALPVKAGGDGEASTDGDKKEAKKEEKAAKKNDGNAAATTKSRDVADMYPFPVHQPLPPYVMSYNRAQPAASHAYYAAPMPTATQGYVYYPAYASPPPEFYNSAPTDLSWSSSQLPTHTYDTLFSEENPNGCVVM